VALLALPPRSALAHGFGQRYDLPVPLWLWATAAATAVTLSFVVIGIFVRARPGAPDYWRLDLLCFRWGRVLAARSVRLVARVVAVATPLLLIAAGLAGDQSPTRNIVPTAVWVGWWVGFAYLSTLVGNLWAVVNPRSAPLRLVGRVARPSRASLPLSGLARYVAGRRPLPGLRLDGAGLHGPDEPDPAGSPDRRLLFSPGRR
jgi:hypothetical protein